MLFSHWKAQKRIGVLFYPSLLNGPDHQAFEPLDWFVSGAEVICKQTGDKTGNEIKPRHLVDFSCQQCFCSKTASTLTAVCHEIGI